MVSIRSRSVLAALAIAVSVAAVQLAPAHAEAQPCPMGAMTCSRVTPDAKGIIGLGLIGAELGFIIPALVQEAMHTNEWWPYLVFPALGAIGGVIGGWAVEQETRNTPEVDVALLVIGMALIVPTMVGTLALTAYDPADSGQGGGSGDDDDEISDPDFRDETTTEAVQVEDTGETGGGDTGGGGSDTGGGDDTSSSVRRRMDAILAGGPGLLRFDGSRILLGVTIVGRMSTYTAEERRALQLAPSFDVLVPVVTGTF